MLTTMSHEMNARYRTFRRGWGTYYCEDLLTKKQESLQTRDLHEARRLVAARNEAEQGHAFSRRLARVYWQAGDPSAATRTWRHVMEEIPKLKHGSTQSRWQVAIADKALDPLRDLILLDTRPEHLLRVLEAGTVSTNTYLRRIQNFALGMDWLPCPIVNPRQWPRIRHGERRGITREEHERIVQREGNPEWRAFFEMCWLMGGSQTDVASLTAEDVDWQGHTISYRRQKTGTPVLFSFGEQMQRLLESLPREGALFPRIVELHEKHRAKHFHRRCRGLGIQGVSLHSYRYAWAERARQAGFPERFAQEALGHNSVAVHRAYARKAQVTLPSLEDYERKLVPLTVSSSTVELGVLDRAG